MNTPREKKDTTQICQEMEKRLTALKEQSIDSQIAAEMDLREVVSDRIYEMMEEQGVTQAELARRLGRSRARISNILSGANLTLDTLADICHAMGHRARVTFEPITSSSAQQSIDLNKLDAPVLRLIEGGLHNPSDYEGFPIKGNLHRLSDVSDDFITKAPLVAVG